jgi:ATP-dependent RNA helicase DHX37/DHR1
MRRSKAIPAKMVKNYRKVSQRRMTEHDELAEEAEMERLRGLLATAPSTDDNDSDSVKQVQTPTTVGDNDAENPYAHIMDADELERQGGYGDDSNPLILPSARPRKDPNQRASRVVLSKEEVKAEKKTRKQNERKLKQLEARQESKARRTNLYQKLEATAVALPQDLLQSSATLGKRQTKRQRLQRILHKERAGLALSESEKEDLYQDRPTVDDSEAPTVPARPIDEGRPSKRPKGSDTVDADPLGNAWVTVFTEEHMNTSTTTNAGESSTADAQPPKSTLSLAAQMMASVTQLSQATSGNGISKTTLTEDSLNRLSPSSAKDKRYIPTDPTILQTAAHSGLAATPLPASRLKIRAIERPTNLQEARSSLPVGSMEFEVMDAVRTSDVTIVCGETGSGKSTQIPQFLYEAGLTQHALENGPHYQIAITQPRRVAAVSTAKRVSYEMCCGDGHEIPSKNNLVAYQTRYETAGLGPATHIKFMTDGILLQEIQSDLLLRKYSVIVLDEAHERNLNTDVLIGLLSVALPLRKQAAAEDKGLVPLRVIIMSATLRVEDFTANDKLFAWTTPSVVRIPGRTFPVTIHHAKTTELDDYEGAALKKICKIHHKLPAGGILVFLTGKQEIARMVKKIERMLNPKQVVRNKSTDVAVVKNDGEVLRDMDDEEIDGDIFKGALEGEENDFDEMENGEDLAPVAPPADDDDSGIPRKVVVLPLYSLLSTDDQAKIFRPIPDNHRLIVVATNIAETVRGIIMCIFPRLVAVAYCVIHCVRPRVLRFREYRT